MTDAPALSATQRAGADLGQHGLPRYDWREIARHNRKRDCWIVIDDVVYDVTAWVDRHPGGDIICTMAGDDASALFHSSHFRDVSARLKQYRIGVVESPAATLAIDSPFLRTLKSRVHRYFRAHAIDYRRTRLLRPQLAGSIALFLAAWAAVYVFALYPFVVLMGVISCALVGGFAHEYCHSTLIREGNRPNVKSVGCSVIWALVCPFMLEKHFQYEHLSHHKVPMDDAFDYEIFALRRVLRLSPQIPYRSIFKYQQYYAPLVYAFYISTQVIVGFTSNFFDKRNLSSDRSFWPQIYVMPVVTVVFHVALPIYLVGVSWWIICFVAYNMVWQFFTYVVAAAVHMTSERDTRSDDWAYLVCSRSVNVLCGNRMYDWLSGGFNYQIDHHLLPTIAREHLPRITHIVRRTCAEFGYPYKEYASLGEYLRDHYRYLFRLGREGGKIELAGATGPALGAPSD
jgi:fatty acid desaturase